MIHRVERLIGNERFIVETGKLAPQADGAVTVQYGNSVVLATACVSQKPREGGMDFLPLTVDFEERLYAIGKIPGSFFRREGRPSQDGILSARVTDRMIRPLFPKGFRNEIQVVLTVLSADQENPPDMLSAVGASAALSLSSIPFDGPVSAVRMGYVNGELLANPTFTQLEDITSLRIQSARRVMSSRLPIGVATTYRVGIRLSVFYNTFVEKGCPHWDCRTVKMAYFVAEL